MIPFLYLSILIFIAPIQAGDAPVIQISTGRVKGEEKESRDDKKFYAYRGIPYATAQRFEPPQPPKNWSDVRDAEEYGKKCMQYSVIDKKVTGSEDCQFINVFTPETNHGLYKKLLPVMVFISGSFMDGSAETYRPHYFMDEEVIIVTFNYRLNVFGFLSTGDEVIQGNFGLKDQIAALQWIQTNIRKFSGDKNRVTIFGQGDGASSVHLLLLSPVAKGLYRKAITQSGSALKLNVIQKNPKLAAQRIARMMDCEKVLKLNETGNATKPVDDHSCSFDYENSTQILECLKLVDAKKLAEVQTEAFTLMRDPLSFFGPVIEIPTEGSNSKESAVISEHPYSTILSGKQNRVPWMTGLNADEGLIKAGAILNDKTFVDSIDSNWGQLSPKLLQYDSSRTDITQNTQRFYLRGDQNADNHSETSPQTTFSSTPTMYPTLSPQSLNSTTSIPHTPEDFFNIHFEEQFKGFTNLFTDRFYAVGIFDGVRLQSQFSPVYAYLNSYKGQYSMYTEKPKEPTPAVKKVTNWFKTNVLRQTPLAPKHLGVCNGDELFLLFKYPDLKVKENTQDYEMSKQLVKLWVQFATDETKMVFNNIPWRPISYGSDSSMQVMKFGSSEQDSSFGVMSDTFMTRMKFWSTLKYLAPFDQ